MQWIRTKAEENVLAPVRAQLSKGITPNLLALSFATGICGGVSEPNNTSLLPLCLLKLGMP